MKKLLLMMMLLPLMGMGQPSYYEINPQLLPYFHEFVEVVEGEGLDLSYIYEGTIVIRLGDYGKNYSLGRGVDGAIIISIDKTIWSSLSDADKRRVMFHELGHDILNLGHSRNGLMATHTHKGSMDNHNPVIELRRIVKKD